MEKLSKGRKRLYIILSSLVILLYLGTITFNLFLERLVKKELVKQLNESPNSLYKLSFEDVDIQIFRGNIEVKGLDFMPSDSARQLLEDGKIKNLVHSHIPRFKIKDLHIYDLLIHNIIDISAILIDGIQVDYLINTKVKSPERKSPFALHSLFSENFTTASIGTIEINADKLRFHSVDTQQDLFNIDSVSFLVEAIRIDQESLKLPIPVLFDDVSIKTRHFMLNSMEHYRIATSDIQFDVEEATLTIHNFKLIPKESREAFNKKIPYNTDWFSIETSSIVFKGLSIGELEFNQMLSFESVQVNDPVIEIYRDKRLPDAPFKYKPLLGGMVHKIPININLDTLMVNNAKLSYQEQTDASDQPGTVYFEPLFLTAYHVTNNEELIGNNPIMHIDLNGKIMAKSDIQAALEIDLSSKHEEFTINGSLQPVSGTIFNPMVEHLMPISIVQGDVTKTNFHFSANDDISHGQLTLEYKDLTINVVKAKDQSKKAGLITLVAKGVIRKHNLPEKGKYITGTIRFERRKDRAIVNFLWNSVKTGIISVIVPIADQNKKIEKQEKKEVKKEQKKKRKKDRNRQ